MKKLATFFPNVTILSIALAYLNQVMDSAATHDAVRTRLFHYTCQGSSNIEVTYGFNNVNHPTYASAIINDSKRFMPINYEHTDNMLLSNYHKVLIVLVNPPSDEILYKDCKIDCTKKLKDQLIKMLRKSP